MGSMHLGLEGLDDGGAALAAFYSERAAGGAALIVTGGSAVSRVGAGGRNYSFVNEEADGVRLSRVATAIHDAGGLVLLQLFHAGRYAYEASFGLTPVAPSAVYSRYSRCEPRALSGEEVLETIEDFARGARRARELGFDGVEIMGSEGYLVDQFLAPATNLRDDEWGGDLVRRMRFALAVAAAVRAAGGPGQAVVFRMSGASFVEGGGTQADVLELARALASGGAVDAINVGMGWHESRVPTVQALVPHGAWRPWARAVKEAVGVPVIASNRINTVELTDAVLAAGDADFVSMARPFLADPEIVRKARDRAGGRAVNVCIACNQACIDRSIFDKPRVVRGQPPRRLRARARRVRRPGRLARAGRGRRRGTRRHGGGARPRRRRPPGLPVRGLRAARRSVPDGVPDPGQGGLRGDDRLLRGGAGAAGRRSAPGERGPRRRGAGRVRLRGGRDGGPAPAGRAAGRRSAPCRQLCRAPARQRLGRERRDHRRRRDRGRRRAPRQPPRRRLLWVVSPRPAGASPPGRARRHRHRVGQASR